VNVGVLGGTFNPIHIAHLRLAEEMREALALERVLLVPAGDPPLKRRGIASASHRLEMVKRAAASNPGARDLRPRAFRRADRATASTLLAELRERTNGCALFLVGADTLRDLEAWREPEALRVRPLRVATRLATRSSCASCCQQSSRARSATGRAGLCTRRKRAASRSVHTLAISASDVRRRVAAAPRSGISSPTR
jgi:nicotinate (nicotinamide) nucleotide adenylyltransferase